MGYRSRLGKVAKKEKERFEGKTAGQVEAMIHESKTPYYPEFHIQLYELGKYFEFTKGQRPFYSFNVYDEFESEFCIMSKDELKELIREYHDLIYKNYERLATGVEDSAEFLASRARTWCSQYLDPYYLDQEKTDGEIASSWQYEYAIFNLIYIYRTFDWDNDYLIYSAW